MPILESDAADSARRSILLTTGLGGIFGLFSAIPLALGARAMGVRWLPYSGGVILIGLVVGLSLAYLVVAFLVDAPYTRFPTSAGQSSPVLQPLRTTDNGKSRKTAVSTTRQRLAEENARLERLDAEREFLHDSRFGTTTEQRVVWGELLELELQDIDEQASRICSAADVATRPCPQTSSGWDTYQEQRRSS